MSLHQTAQDGNEVQRMLDSEVFKEAMKLLKAQIHYQWESCHVLDKEEPQALLQLAKVANMFEGILVGMVQKGSHAQNKIDLSKASTETPVRKFFRKVA